MSGGEAFALALIIVGLIGLLHTAMTGVPDDVDDPFDGGPY